MESEHGNYILYGESALLILLFVAGLVINIPVIVVYFQSKHIRSITDKFLLNLIIADVISLALLFPSIFINFIQYSIEDIQIQDDSSHSSQVLTSPLAQGTGTDYRIIGQNYFHNGSRNNHSKFEDLESNSFAQWSWNCGLSNGLFAGLATASVFAALEIAMERYLAVVKPLHYHKFLTAPSIFITSLIGGIISLSTAVISTLDPTSTIFPHCMNRVHKFNHTIGNHLKIASHPHFPSKEYSDNNEEESHYFWMNQNELFWQIYTIIHTTLFFLLPVLIMTFIYCTIYFEARSQKIKMMTQFKPYFVPVPPIEIDLESGPKGKSKFHPIFIKFKLMDRLRAAHIDRAARVAVFTLFVTIFCWSPYYFLRLSEAIRFIIRYIYSSGEDVSLNGGQIISRWSLWTSYIVPLLFACLHPVLSPIFYSYRYERLRLEIRKLFSGPISICTDHDKAKSQESKTNKGFNTNSTSGGGSPCIRQAIITHPAISSIIITPAENNVQNEEDDSYNDFSNTQTNPESNLKSSHTCIDFCTENRSMDAGNNDLVINVPPESNVEDNGLISKNTANCSKNAGQSMAVADRSVGNLYNYLTVWMSSYSRRWLQHRESVTSTASIITLLNHKYSSKNNPVADV